MQWEICRLGDVCEIDKLQCKRGDLPYVGMEDIEGFTGRFLGELSPRSVVSSTFQFTNKHVLYGRLRPYLNKVLVPDFEGHCSTEIFPLKPCTQLDRKFLYYWLTSDAVVREVDKTCTGARMPRANVKEIMTFPIPIPLIPEQKRIVTILDQAFADIEQARANAEQNLKNARELFESKKRDIFSLLDSKVQKIALPDVCDEMFAGGDAPKKGDFSRERTDSFQIPIIANAVKNNGLYGYTNYARVENPSITIAARGSGTGHIELREGKYLPIVRVIVLVPDASRVNLVFLKHSLKNLDILRSGSAIPQLTVPMIKGYSIPLPTLVQQEKIVEELDVLSIRIDSLLRVYESKQLLLVGLKKSILQKAFTGELTKHKTSEENAA